MRLWTSLAVFVTVALGLSAGAARAVDEGKLKNLSAPPPVTVTSLPADARTVRFAKLVVQLKPEPWAFLRNNDSLAWRPADRRTGRGRRRSIPACSPRSSTKS